jgi:hypothetical protein
MVTRRAAAVQAFGVEVRAPTGHGEWAFRRALATGRGTKRGGSETPFWARFATGLLGSVFKLQLQLENQFATGQSEANS